jgi:hypothetical protein
VLPLLSWNVVQIVIDNFFPIVSACVFNQSHKHWLLNDALNATIITTLKFQGDIMICVVLYIMIDDDKGGYNIKLLEFFVNIKQCDLCILVFLVKI